jgi:hypothetical protein
MNKIFKMLNKKKTKYSFEFLSLKVIKKIKYNKLIFPHLFLA